MSSDINKFDLNIERVLEDWEVFHALREVIANALDEQVLTNTPEIQIFKDKENLWHIRDFGRGIKIEHFTQNEDDEKLNHPDLVIGKFGVGLKDAFATFDRNNIKVLIMSKYGSFTLDKTTKHGFDNISTLHVIISAPSDVNFIGTEFILGGVNAKQIELAKDFFLKFSDEILLEKTQFGEVFKTNKSKSRIYINGVRVAEEENFLFSYNITSVTKAIKKVINRERTHVGRSAYTDRVKAILMNCREKNVAEMLVNDLKNFERGICHDELTWTDVSVYACKLLNSIEKVIFLTPFELMQAKDMADRAINDGYKVITIPENVKYKIERMKDIEGNPIRDLGTYIREFNDSFEFKFINEKDLTEKERAVYNQTNQILNLIGGKPIMVKEILISETMRLEEQDYFETGGIWELSTNRIIIKRDQLGNINLYASTLLHEIAHAKSGASDVSRDFENQLTRQLGFIAGNIIRKD